MSAEKELRGENGAFDTETAGFGGASASARPKMNADKELRIENGEFDTETTRFPTMREVRSARKRPKRLKILKKIAVVWSVQTPKK